MITFRVFAAICLAHFIGFHCKVVAQESDDDAQQLEQLLPDEELDGEQMEELEQEIDSLKADLVEGEQAQPPASAAPNIIDASALPVQLRADEIVLAGRDSFEHRMAGLLKSTCLDCHDSASKAGDLDLEFLVATTPFAINRSHWRNVIAQIKNRSMPPADVSASDQLGESDRRYLTAWLTDAVENFDYATLRSVGYEPARRLTHDEYNNTVRDLFGMDLRPADKFPDDMAASSGFDNSANSLSIQPITMERYVGAADEVATAVMADAEGKQRLIGADEYHQALKRFATRAFRRPLSDADLESLQNYFKAVRADGSSLDQALQSTIEAVLVSPSFLVRSEALTSTERPFRVSDWELASRLSYFLWASMPDDELFRIAATGELQQHEVLRVQVDRMIADPKSASLGELFASQWLGYNDINRVRPGPIDNPWCTDSLCDAIARESGMFFRSLVIENAPIERLIDADYTFLNDELAEHYRIPNVEGKQMRRVSVQGTSRGGVLAHASVLAITSFPHRVSPVMRGNWILTELLGTPPPPPPPNASEFDERLVKNRSLSQRQKLQRHRSDPNCYACHSQIDPLGFSLEKFDWFGRDQTGAKFTGMAKFAGGPEFVGLDGLRQVIIRDRIGDLTRQLASKMFSYALGRQLEYYDVATLNEIVLKTENQDRRMQALIHAIVASDTFQMKQLSHPPQEN